MKIPPNREENGKRGQGMSKSKDDCQKKLLVGRGTPKREKEEWSGRRKKKTGSKTSSWKRKPAIYETTK